MTPSGHCNVKVVHDSKYQTATDDVWKWCETLMSMD